MTPYHAADRTARQQTERFKAFYFDDLAQRDKANLDVFWLKDKSLKESANLPHSDVIATEIGENLAAALDQITEIAASLSLKSGQQQQPPSLMPSSHHTGRGLDAATPHRYPAKSRSFR